VRGRAVADREADIEAAEVCVSSEREGRGRYRAAGEAVAKDQENDAFRVWCIARVIRSYVNNNFLRKTKRMTQVPFGLGVKGCYVNNNILGN
jgi:hypothetical protein